MKASFVMPVHDASGTILAHLESERQLLEQCASEAFVGVTAMTAQCCPDAIRRLEHDAFIKLLMLPDGARIGDQFRSLYRSAASSTPATQQLHLCFADRLVFTMRSQHQGRFMRDVEAATGRSAPVLFVRSERAWATHPKTYRTIEGFVTSLGELLFGRRLEFAWCHLVIQAEMLAEIVETLQNHDLSIMAEMILAIRDELHVQEADWLEWEEPFTKGLKEGELRQQRDESTMEAEKRLAYVVPMMQTLVRAAQAI